MVLHYSLALVNSFNKTEAANFLMPAMFSEEFPFFPDCLNVPDFVLHVHKTTIHCKKK